MTASIRRRLKFQIKQKRMAAKTKRKSAILVLHLLMVVQIQIWRHQDQYSHSLFLHLEGFIITTLYQVLHSLMPWETQVLFQDIQVHIFPSKVYKIIWCMNIYIFRSSQNRSISSFTSLFIERISYAYFITQTSMN